MPPLVSVVVTTYNQASYIETALASVFAQTYPAHQIVVVDDGSTDETPDLLAPYRERVLYWRQSNQGVAAARNAGIERATGELIAFLDGDDVWEPSKLELQVEAARRHPESGAIVTDGIHFDGDTILRSSLIGSQFISALHGPEPMALSCYRELLLGNLIATTSQVMIPRRVFDVVGVSDTRFALASDWDLYLRIAARYLFTFVPQKLIRWRYHASSASGPREVRALRWTRDNIAVLKVHRPLVLMEDLPVLQQSLRANIRDAAQMAYYHGRRSDRRLALRYLVRLLRDNPLSAAVALYLLALTIPAPLVRLARRWLSGPAA